MAKAVYIMILVVHFVSSALTIHLAQQTPAPHVKNRPSTPPGHPFHVSGGPKRTQGHPFHNSLGASTTQGHPIQVSLVPSAPQGDPFHDSLGSGGLPLAHLSHSKSFIAFGRDNLVSLKSSQTMQKRRAELVDGDWFQNSPPVSFEKRMLNSYHNNKVPVTTKGQQVHPLSQPPQRPSHFLNRIPMLGDAWTEIATTADGVQDGDSSIKNVPDGPSHKADFMKHLPSSNTLPKEKPHHEHKSDVISLPLPSQMTMDKEDLESGYDPSAIRESNAVAALLRTIWYARRAALNHRYNYPAHDVPGTEYYGRVFPGHMKRAYTRYDGEEMFQKRPFDSLANGLIGKRSNSPRDTQFRKRPFDTLANRN